MDESESTDHSLIRAGLGLGLALAPILVMAAAALLLNAGMLAQPGGAVTVAMTPYIWASALLIPIGLLIVGLAIPTEGSPRPLVVGCILAVGVPVLLVLWFLALLTFSGAAGEPF